MRSASTSRTAGSSSTTSTSNRSESIFLALRQREPERHRGDRALGLTDELDWRLLSPHDDQKGRRFPELFRLVNRHDTGDNFAVLQHRRCSRRVLSRDDFILAGRKNDRAINRAIDLRERGRVERPRRMDRAGAGDEETFRAFGDEDAL